MKDKIGFKDFTIPIKVLVVFGYIILGIYSVLFIIGFFMGMVGIE